MVVAAEEGRKIRAEMVGEIVMSLVSTPGVVTGWSDGGARSYREVKTWVRPSFRRLKNENFLAMSDSV